MKLTMRKVEPEEIEPLHEILKKCGLDEQARFGLGYWVPPYPLEAMRKSAEERDVYAVYDGDELVATFTTGTQQPSYYLTIPGVREAWDASGEPALYLSRLAVLPEFQGRGIGTWCIKRMERLARAEGCKAVRFDAYDKHLKLLEYYDRLGYHRRGTFTFNTKRYGETGMVCFEKLSHEFVREE
jgi:GNAT superfamily N-acetyltransferase